MSFRALPLISIDDIDVTFQKDTTDQNENEDAACNMFSWTKITTPPPAYNLKFQTPTTHIDVFKVPMLPQSPYLRTYNQPITWTPLTFKTLDIDSFTSPCLSQKSFSFRTNDNFIIPTPMIISSLKSLNSVNAPYFNCLGSDIIQLIDESENTVKRRQNVELDDSNIVDYLLNMSHNTTILVKQDNKEETISIKRRKGRHAKRMTEEETKAYKVRRKEKEKERRKERLATFKKEEKGITRRSKRSRNRTVDYTK